MTSGNGLHPDDDWHSAAYVPRRTWKCWVGLHRWVSVKRHSTPDWRFYDDLKCWRCHKAKTVEVAFSDLFYRRRP